MNITEWFSLITYDNFHKNEYILNTFFLLKYQTLKNITVPRKCIVCIFINKKVMSNGKSIRKTSEKCNIKKTFKGYL